MSFLVTLGSSHRLPIEPEKNLHLVENTTSQNEDTSTDALAIVPTLPSTARNLIEGEEEPQEEVTEPNHETKSYLDYWNTTKFVAAEFAAVCSYAAKRVALNTVSGLATLNFDYKTEVEQQRKFISDITKSDYVDLIINVSAHEAIKYVISWLENPDVTFTFKQDILSYIKDYKEYFNGFLEIIILRSVSTIIRNVEKEWEVSLQNQIEKAFKDKGFTKPSEKPTCISLANEGDFALIPVETDIDDHLLPLYNAVIEWETLVQVQLQKAIDEKQLDPSVFIEEETKNALMKAIQIEKEEIQRENPFATFLSEKLKLAFENNHSSLNQAVLAWKSNIESKLEEATLQNPLISENEISEKRTEIILANSFSQFFQAYVHDAMNEVEGKLVDANPFSSYISASLLKRYKAYFEKVDNVKPIIGPKRQAAIFALPSSKERIDAWADEFSIPFVKEIIDQFLPDKTALIPVTSALSPLLKKHIFPRIFPKIIDCAGEYLAKLKEMLSNPDGGKEIRAKQEEIEKFIGGKELVKEIKDIVDKSFLKVPAFAHNLAIPLAGKKASSFLVNSLQQSEAFQEVGTSEIMQKQMENWIIDRIQSGLAEGDNIHSVLPIIKEQIHRYFFSFIDALLKKSGLSPESRANAKDTVSVELKIQVVSFFEREINGIRRKDDLLQFEKSLEGMDEKTRVNLITQKYGPLCKEFLDSFHTGDKLAIEKIVIKFFPVYLRALFIAIQQPLEERKQAVKLIVGMATGDLTTQLESKVLANEQFVDDGAAALGNFLNLMVRDQLQCSETEKSLIAVLQKYAQQYKIEFDKDFEKTARETLAWFNNPNAKGVQTLAWGKIEEIIQIALLQGVRKLFENSSLDLDIESDRTTQADLGNVFIVLMEILNKSSIAIGSKRKEEQKRFQARLKELNTQKAILENKLLVLESELIVARERGILSVIERITKEFQSINIPLQEVKKEIADEKTRHHEILGTLFSDSITRLMGALSIKNVEDIVVLVPEELRSAARPLVKMVWYEMVPQILGKAFEKTLRLSDNRDQLQAEVTALYNDGVPALFSHIQALHLKAWLPRYLKKEINSATKPVITVDGATEEKESHITVIEKVLEGIASFYKSKGAKIANLDKTTGQRVAEYITVNKAHLTQELAKALEKTGREVNFDTILDAGAGYVESFLLEIFKGAHLGILDLESKDPAIFARLLKKWVEGINSKLHQANNAQSHESEIFSSVVGVTVPHNRRLLDRISDTFGMDINSIPAPDQGKKALLDMINDTVLPNAFSALVSKFVNEQTLRKTILTALELYNKKVTQKQELKDEVYEQHQLARRHAIMEGTPLPQKRLESNDNSRELVLAAEVVQPLRDPQAHAELVSVFSQLLTEFATASGDPIIKMVLKGKLQATVSGMIADTLYDEITGKKIINHTITGLEAAMGNLNLAVAEGDTLRTLKKINLVRENQAAYLFDDTTNQRITNYSFNFEPGTELPTVIELQAGNDEEISNSSFSYTAVTNYVRSFFTNVIESASAPLSDHEKINQLLSNIGVGFLKSSVKDKLLNYWDAFQDSFYANIRKIPYIGNNLAKLKLKLDDFCWALYSYTLGKVFLMMSKIAKSIFTQRINVLQTRVLEKFNAIFNEKTLSEMGLSTLNILENTRAASQANVRVDTPERH